MSYIYEYTVLIEIFTTLTKCTPTQNKWNSARNTQCTEILPPSLLKKKIFFFFSPKGEIKTEKKGRKLQVQWTLRKKSPSGKLLKHNIRTSNSIPISNEIHYLYTPFSLGSMTEKSFLQTLQTWKGTKNEKRERPGVRESHCVFFQASCASLRVGFFQCCWQWGEPLWWLMLLRAPVWCSNCPSRCSPGLRCPVRRWIRRSRESLLSTASRPLGNNNETRITVHEMKHTGGRKQLNATQKMEKSAVKDTWGLVSDTQI